MSDELVRLETGIPLAVKPTAYLIADLIWNKKKTGLEKQKRVVAFGSMAGGAWTPLGLFAKLGKLIVG